MSNAHTRRSTTTEPGADLVFKGGTVLTMNPRLPRTQAVAVRCGRVLAAGPEHNVLELAGKQTRVIDLHGGALLPGINDSHVHGAMLGSYWPNYWLDSLSVGKGLPECRELGDEEARRAALRRAWDVLMPLGITSYTEPGLGPGADRQHGGSCGAATLATYRAMDAAGELPVRVTALELFGEIDGPCDPSEVLRGIASVRVDPPSPDRHLRVAGLKIFADGIPPARSAWMNTPYEDGGNSSLLVGGDSDEARADSLIGIIDAADAAGLQIGVHATGSRTVDVTVAAFARAARRHGAQDLRHYIIHGDCASDAALASMSRNRVGFNSQTAIYDRMVPGLEAAVGAERTRRAFPVGTAARAGVEVSLSSDTPVAAPDWRLGVAAAAARDSDEGSPGQRSEHVSVADALRAYTIIPAWQDHAETWKGSIEVGKVADLCVLDADPMSLPATAIPEIAVKMTIVDGTVVYEQD